MANGEIKTPPPEPPVEAPAGPSGEGMIVKKAVYRILDPVRRIVIDRGSFIKAVPDFFEKYGSLFSNTAPGPADTPITISEYGDKTKPNRSPVAGEKPLKERLKEEAVARAESRPEVPVVKDPQVQPGVRPEETAAEKQAGPIRRKKRT